MPIKALSQATTFIALENRVDTAEADIVDLQTAGSGGTAADPTTIAADTNNLAVSANEVIPLSNTTGSSKNLTGIAGGTDDKVKRLVNAGTSTIILVGESASSTAANRFASGATLNAGQIITIIYKGSTSRWEVFS